MRQWVSYLLIITLLLPGLAPMAKADDSVIPKPVISEEPSAESPTSTQKAGKTSSRAYPKKRNYFWPPIYSLLVPGLDQWIRREWVNGAAFSGVGFGGIALQLSLSDRRNNRLNLETRVDRERFEILGLQMYGTSGMLSARHAFRDAVETRPDDFSFLVVKETDWDILKAPLHVDYLIRPSTFIPMLALGTLIALGAHSENGNHHWNSPNTGDIFFSTAFSYGAGTGEEAFFRGFLMPTTMKWTNSGWGSNAIQATLFALAHGINPIPWPQFLLGFYLGWLNQSQGWALSESIFIHTWWDVAAFLTTYCFRKSGQEATLYLTPIALRF